MRFAPACRLHCSAALLLLWLAALPLPSHAQPGLVPDTDAQAGAAAETSNSTSDEPAVRAGAIIELRGQISAFEFSQPQTRIGLRNGDQQWQLLAPPAAELRRLGWTSKSLFVGETVEIRARRLAGPENRAQLGRLTRANGQTLGASIAASTARPSFAMLPAGNYALDPSYRGLRLQLDQMGFMAIDITFARLTAELKWNGADPQSSSLRFQAAAASLRSNVSALDASLSGASFFAVDRHPRIRFVSTAIRVLQWGELLVDGQLEMRGIRRPVTLRARLNKIGQNPRRQTTAAGLSLHGNFRRSDWNINAPAGAVDGRIALFLDGQFNLTAL